MSRFAAIATAALLALIPTARAAELLVNGGFETESNFNNTAIAGYNGSFAAVGTGQLPGWTVTAGHAVTLHNTTAYPYITGNYSVNLDGEGYNRHNADFYQDFSTVSGATYNVSFDHVGWYSGQTLGNVTITNLAGNLVYYSVLFGWTPSVFHESASFVSPGGALRIHVSESPESTVNDNVLMVDNFSVTGQAVPLPAAALAGAPLLTLLAATRLRRRRPTIA